MIHWLIDWLIDWLTDCLLDWSSVQSTLASSLYSPCLCHFPCMFPSSLCPVTSESRISWRNLYRIEKIPAWLLRRLQNAEEVQSDKEKTLQFVSTKQVNHHHHHYHCNVEITVSSCPIFSSWQIFRQRRGFPFQEASDIFSMRSKTVLSPYLEIWIWIFVRLVWTPAVLVVQSSLRWSVIHIWWIPRWGKYSSARDCVIFHSKGIAAASDVWNNQLKEKRIPLTKNHFPLQYILGPRVSSIPR